MCSCLLSTVSIIDIHCLERARRAARSERTAHRCDSACARVERRGVRAQAPLDVDAIIADNSAVHLAGRHVPAGTYLRSGIGRGRGESRGHQRAPRLGTLPSRPVPTESLGAVCGGGLSARFDDGSRSRVYLLVLLGVGGPAKRGLGSSFEAGFGGGGRIGVVIRRATAERR